MPEQDETLGNGDGGAAAEVEEAPEKVADSGGQAADTGRELPKKLLIPAAVAAGVAAAGYAAKKKGPDLKRLLSSSAADKAEDAAESTLGAAEEKGGVVGLASKLVKKGADGGGAGGLLSTIVSPFKGSGKEPSEGWGKGRRNPIQLVAEVAVPLETAYNQWTQLEEFPKFMHRVTSVQVDDEDRSKVKWQEKIWFSKRQWDAQVTEQTPDKKIAWRTVSGTKHVGHVTFHRLDDELTRVVVNLDFSPAGLFEKLASGLRFAKRAAKSDVHRYKAFVETHGEATGAWRGRIENGEVVEDPGVEERKPFEQGKELRTPGRNEDERGAGADEGGDERDRELEERRAEREERRRARDRERRANGEQEEEQEERVAEREPARAGA